MRLGTEVQFQCQAFLYSLARTHMFGSFLQCDGACLYLYTRRKEVDDAYILRFQRRPDILPTVQEQNSFSFHRRPDRAKVLMECRTDQPRGHGNTRK